MRKKLCKILVTGGAGFIGSEFVKQAVKKRNRIVVVDKLTYAGDLERMKEIKSKIRFYKADICERKKIESIIKIERPKTLVHFAAESHVDRSIIDPTTFLNTNIIGTQILLDISRKFNLKRFIHISTDEVYGDIRKGCFKEASPLRPNSPYAASKAASDLLVQSYIRTYNFPAIIIRPSNNYGPWQYPEKFIPVVILKALRSDKVPVYADGKNRREWLYVSDCARGIFKVLEKGKNGDIYNLGSNEELRNIDVAKTILEILRKSRHLIWFVKDRPGHDFRYLLDSSKIEKLGWSPRVNFESGLRETIKWNQQNRKWLGKKTTILEQYWKKVYKSA